MYPARFIRLVILSGLWLVLTCIFPAKVFSQAGTPDPVHKLSDEVYRQFLKENKIFLSGENPEVETLNRVSSRLLAAIQKFYGEKKQLKILNGYQWEFNLVNSKKADTWCLPGGKIAVYSSLLPVAQSDASLAVAMAHVIAHVLLKHGDKRMQGYLKEFLDKKDLASALSAKPGETKDFFCMANGNSEYVGVVRGFNEMDETDADALGIILCAKAGYHAAEALVFWKRMFRVNGTGIQPELTGTHPVTEQRLTKMENMVDAIEKEYFTPINKN